MIEEHLPGLWRVGGRSWNGTTAELTSQGANTYLLALSDAAVLMDCGTLAERRAIEQNVRQAGIDPDDLTDLILSHSHFDHSEAAAAWQRDRGLTVHLSAVGAEYLSRGDYRLTGSRLNEPGYSFHRPNIDHPMADGETFEIGGASFLATFTPGHTPDSTLVSLALGGRGVGFCGDVTFGPNDEGRLGNVGWLCMLWQSDLHAYRTSLRKMARMKLDVLFPGHGSPVVGASDVAEAIAASLATIEHFLADPLIRNFGMQTD